jgi:uncharacterized repeat protein (TIGR03803 family)
MGRATLNGRNMMVRIYRTSIELLESRSLLSATLGTLKSFYSDDADGAYPTSGLIADSAGNLYGMTEFGGTSNDGTVFKVAAGSRAVSVVASFDRTTGYHPDGELFVDKAGNLYGTTRGNGGETQYGTIFKIAAGSHTVTTVVSFNSPYITFPSSFLFDSAGNIYGTTWGSNDGQHLGTIFKVAAGSHTFTTLATFNGTNGGGPQGLISDSKGNLYGTTGGRGPGGYGTVFEMAAGTHTITTLVAFNGKNGGFPQGHLIMDAAGNLFGTTSGTGQSSFGTVFKVATGTHAFSTLAQFNSTNGGFVYAGLIEDAAANFYGTVYGGGANSNGTVFKVAAGSHAISTLATFNGTNGAEPATALIADAAGNLYGTTISGGFGGGTVFELSGSGFVIPKITATAPAAQTATAGTSKTFALGSFTRVAATGPYSIDVKWGDGSADTKFTQSSTGTFAAKQHTFTKATTDTITVSITDAKGLKSNAATFKVKVSAAAASKLVFKTLPTNATHNEPFSIHVAVEDRFGNVVSGDNSSITLSLASEPAGAVLSGTVTVADALGIATFSDLKVTKSGRYTFKAIDGSLASAVSASFAVT